METKHSKMNNSDYIYLQQGDCLLKKCGTKGIFVKEFETIPEDAMQLKTNLVLKGVTNNHAL